MAASARIEERIRCRVTTGQIKCESGICLRLATRIYERKYFYSHGSLETVNTYLCERHARQLAHEKGIAFEVEA